MTVSAGTGEVHLGPAGWSVAVVGGAAAVLVVQGDALVCGEQASFPAHVEWHGVAVEDHRDDPGPAGQPTGLPGADPVPGVDGRDAEPADQRVEGEGDHHRER